MAGNRILITGAAGYIGSPVLDQMLNHLNASDLEYILAIDRVGVPASFSGIPNAEWLSVNLDEVDASWWETTVNDKAINTIYYLESIENINLCSTNNLVNETLQLSDFYFASFLENRTTTPADPILKVVYISTDRIYYEDDFPNEIHDITLRSAGSQSELTVSDSNFSKEKRGYFYSYVAAKALTEIKLQQLTTLETDAKAAIDLRIIRPFAITGPTRNQECPIATTIKIAQTNQDIPLYETGSQGVAFTHVNDLVTLLVHENLFDPDVKLELTSSIINFCRVQNYLSVRQLSEKIINKTESSSKLVENIPVNIFSEIQSTPQIRNLVRIYQPVIPIEIILEESIYELDPVTHYADFIVNDPVTTDVGITITGSAEPDSSIVIWFGNGEVVNGPVDSSGNFDIQYTFEYPIDIYPIELNVTTKEYIQYATKIIKN